MQYATEEEIAYLVEQSGAADKYLQCFADLDDYEKVAALKFGDELVVKVDITVGDMRKIIRDIKAQS